MKLGRKYKKQLLGQRSLYFLNINQKGTSVYYIEKDYPFSILVAASKSNTSINQLIEISQCWTEFFSSRTIVDAGDLLNTYAGAVIGTMLDYLAKIVHYGCYPEYSSTIDHTPAMVEEESIGLVLVTKYWKIIELLVMLKLSQKNITA